MYVTRIEQKEKRTGKNGEEEGGRMKKLNRKDEKNGTHD